MSESAVTRQAVLAAALELAGAHGPGAVTIASLTASSGVSTGSIYHHFGSREGVLRRLLIDCLRELSAHMLAALDERPAHECVRDLCERHLTWVAQHPGRAAVLYGVPIERPGLDGDVEARRVLVEKNEYVAPLLAWVQSRIGRGELRDIPLWAVEPVALAPLHEVCRRGLAGLDVVQDVADVVWAGLAPAGASPAPPADARATADATAPAGLSRPGPRPSAPSRRSRSGR